MLSVKQSSTCQQLKSLLSKNDKLQSKHEPFISNTRAKTYSNPFSNKTQIHLVYFDSYSDNQVVNIDLTSSKKLAELANTVSCLFLNLPILAS